jgi:hypothetical protein
LVWIGIIGMFDMIGMIDMIGIIDIDWYYWYGLVLLV